MTGAAACGGRVTDRRPVHGVADPTQALPLLPLIAQGMTNRRIAHELGDTTENAVKTLVRTLLRYLGARDRAHAVARGYQRGLLGPDTHRAAKVRRELADRHASTCALLTPSVCNCDADPSEPENGAA